MSRPQRTPLDASSPGWVTRFNDLAESIVEAPLPLVQYASEGALNTAKDPRLNQDCLALVGSDLYTSDGSSWSLYREQLTFVADLDTGTATVEDIKNAFNGVLADMQAKGWML
jgi:hypothetical protein